MKNSITATLTRISGVAIRNGSVIVTSLVEYAPDYDVNRSVIQEVLEDNALRQLSDGDNTIDVDPNSIVVDSKHSNHTVLFQTGLNIIFKSIY